MKLTYIRVATLAATLFTGSAIANSDEISRDLIYGTVNINSSPSQAYDSSDYDPRGYKDYILDQADSVVPANPHVPYERVENERDNSQNLIDMQS